MKTESVQKYHLLITKCFGKRRLARTIPEETICVPHPRIIIESVRDYQPIKFQLALRIFRPISGCYLLSPDDSVQVPTPIPTNLNKAQIQEFCSKLCESQSQFYFVIRDNKCSCIASPDGGKS